MIRSRLIAMALAGLAIAMLAGTGGQALASNQDPGVLPPQSHPYGTTYGQWSARWWQWALSSPVSDNPVLDPSGADCAVGQAGPVWFLAGTFGGSAARSCTVPAGRALFFPIVNTIYIGTDPTDTAEVAHQAVTEFIDGVDPAGLEAELDGASIRAPGRYRAPSPTFSVSLPDDNVAGLPAGVYGPDAADGYYLMLAPLSRGAHSIHFHGVFADASVLDVTYQIQVV